MSDLIERVADLERCPFCAGEAAGTRRGIVGCERCDIWMEESRWQNRPAPAPAREQLCITGEDVHREWRDGMLFQDRAVAPERMKWETLSSQDRALDDRIAARLSMSARTPPSGELVDVAAKQLIGALYMVKLLKASSHALRSYEYGNSDPTMAKTVANQIDAALAAPAAPSGEPIGYVSFREIRHLAASLDKSGMHVAAKEIRGLTYGRPQPSEPQSGEAGM